VEVILGFIVLILNARNSPRTAALAFTVSLMTLWKTVLYCLQYTDLCGGGTYHSHNDAFTNFLYLWLPNGIWVVVPFLVVCRLWGRVSRGAQGGVLRESDEGSFDEENFNEYGGKPFEIKLKKKV